MAVKSKAHLNKLAELKKAGKISHKYFTETVGKTDIRTLPDRVADKPRSTKFKALKIVK